MSLRTFCKRIGHWTIAITVQKLLPHHLKCCRLLCVKINSFGGFAEHANKLQLNLNEKDNLSIDRSYYMSLMVSTATFVTHTYNPLSESQGWTLGAERHGAVTHDATAGTMTLVNSNWEQEYTYIPFTPITLSQTTDLLRFSHTLNRDDSGASLLWRLWVLILSRALQLQPRQYENRICSNLCFNTKKSPIYSDNQINADLNSIMSTADAGTFNFSDPIEWFNGQFMLTISDGINTVDSIALGTTVDINKVYLYGDGRNNRTNDSSSNLGIEHTYPVPEAAMASLSLLDLAVLMDAPPHEGQHEIRNQG